MIIFRLSYFKTKSIN